MDTLTRVLQYLAPSRPILISGPPGVGKSAVLAAWASAQGRECIAESPVISEAIDYRGFPAPNIAGGYAQWLPIGNLRRITEPDCAAVVLLDDLGQASASVQAALMRLVLARMLGDMPVAPGVSFVGATNRAVDRSAARPILAALLNRAILVNVRAAPLWWAQWAIAQPQLDPLVAAYAKFRPDCFVDTVPAEPMEPFCSPRSLTMAGELMALGTRSLALLGGAIGPAAAADLIAYSEVAGKLPDISTILDAPGRWKVPKDPGLLHAVVCLAARAAMSRPGDIIALANHLGGGWGVALVSATTDVSPEFKATPEFRGWAVSHPEIL